MASYITCAFILCAGVQPPHQPNMAFWQLTVDLPFTLELTFLGGQSDLGEQTFVCTVHKQHASIMAHMDVRAISYHWQAVEQLQCMTGLLH